MVHRPRPAGARRSKPTGDNVATRRWTPAKNAAHSTAPPEATQMIEHAMVNRYIEVIFKLKAGGTFMPAAAELVNELADPSTSASDVLTEIDQNPKSPFELYLHRLVRGRA